MVHLCQIFETGEQRGIIWMRSGLGCPGTAPPTFWDLKQLCQYTCFYWQWHSTLSLIDADWFWCWLIRIDANCADWLWLILIDADWYWLVLIDANDADWFWLMLFDADNADWFWWCWVMLRCLAVISNYFGFVQTCTTALVWASNTIIFTDFIHRDSPQFFFT